MGKFKTIPSILPGNMARFNSQYVLPDNLDLINSMRTSQSEVASAITDEHKKQLCSMIADGSMEQKKEIAEARIDRIRLNVLENLIALDFFQVINLQHNEQPQLYIEKDQFWQVHTIGQHGGTPNSYFVNEDSLVTFTPYIVKTDLALYPLQSAVIGNFTDVGPRVNARVSWDASRKVDIDAWAVLQAQFEATFSDTTNIYKLDPRITSYPTGNYIDFSANGKWDIEVFKKIFSHFALMGQDAPNIRNIYCSPLDVDELWDIPSLVAGFALGGATQDPKSVVTDEIRNQILRSGSLTNLFGHTFSIRAINTLPSGYLHVSTDRPIGWLYRKPSMDKVVFYDERWVRGYMDLDNHEALEMKQVMVPVIPSPLRLNALKIKFK